jgi:hypothetical protein
VRLPLYKNKAPIEVEAPLHSAMVERFRVLGLTTRLT